MSTPMHQRKKNGNSNNMNNRRNIPYSDIEGGRGSNDANANILEQQNNERINELADHVARLKNLTIDIGQEVREQNTFLDKMGEGFVNTRDLLAGSLSRIGTMLEQGGAKHMCYMVAFCVFVMCFLWWLMTFKGSSGA